MQFQSGPYSILLVDEPTYAFGSGDNARTYRTERRLGDPGYRPSAIHGVSCLEEGAIRSSLVVGSSGAGTRVHGHSLVAVEDRCFVAVGSWVLCLRVPSLEVLWQAAGDTATCLGLYLTTDSAYLVVHGECEITKFTTSGRQLWKFSGRDIFTGEFNMSDSTIEVTDFEGLAYFINLENGVGSNHQAG